MTKVKKTRIARPCPYCSKKYVELTKHLKRVHKEETAHLLNLDAKEQNIAFAKLRKLGIDKHNNNCNGDKASMMRERTGKNNLKLIKCQSCLSYLSSSNMSKHKCSAGNPEFKLNSSTTHLFSKIIEGLHCDTIGNFIRRNDDIRNVGKHYCRSIYSERKEKEVMIRIRKFMRTLTTLYMKFLENESTSNVKLFSLFRCNHLGLLNDLID